MIILEILTGGRAFFGIIKEFFSFYKRRSEWIESECNVDMGWVECAKNNGVLPSNKTYSLRSEDRLQSLLLEGKHEITYLLDKKKRTKTKIVVGKYGDRLILVQRIEDKT